MASYSSRQVSLLVAASPIISRVIVTFTTVAGWVAIFPPFWRPTFRTVPLLVVASASLPRNPLADICRAIPERESFVFLLRQEPYSGSMNELHVGNVDDDVAVCLGGGEECIQFRYLSLPDPAAKGEYHRVTFHRTVDFQRH